MQHGRPEHDTDYHVADQRREPGESCSPAQIERDYGCHPEKRKPRKMEKGKVGYCRKDGHVHSTCVHVANDPAE